MPDRWNEVEATSGLYMNLRKLKPWRNFILLLIAATLLFNADQAGHHIQGLSTRTNLGTGTPPSFGVQLASAALERTNRFIVYNPTYVKLSYPMGDVPAIFGVCTDVVIRAYRALGIDLQQQVHERIGGDKNITHRRVRDLRRFLARYGKSMRPSKNPANFKPGDIVTYYLPNARTTTTHIGIVSTRKTLSGRPLLIHNIGFGTQQEDALFAFKMTGHYRYDGGLQRRIDKGAVQKAHGSSPRKRRLSAVNRR